MRNKRKAAQQRLAGALAKAAPVRAADLARDLDISVPTLHRLLQESTEPVLAAGRARRTRYALRRPLRGDLSPLPIHAIDEAGQPHELTALALIQPQGCWADFAGTDWPLNEESRDGWWAGLPYPLYDMRPQGYLGRQLAQRVQDALAVSPNPAAWTDNDILWVRSRMGADLPGNLIVGDAAYRRWQESRLNPPPVLGASEIGPIYDMLPMAYAPLPGGELPRPVFNPPLPLPRERTLWLQACRAAIRFWETTANDERISAPFRAIAEDNAAELGRRAQLVAA